MTRADAAKLGRVLGGSRGRLLAGLLLWIAALMVGAAWFAGRQIWGGGPRRLATPVDQVDVGSSPLRVAVIGDVQNGFSEFADLQALVAQLQPDLVLQLGDTVNNAKPGRYAALHSSIRAHGLGAPLLVVPGNHDQRRADGSLDLFEEWIGPTHWRLDLAGWRILGLDNAAGELSPASRVLLEESAKAAPQHGLIVLAHRPVKETLRPAPALQFAGHVHSSAGFVDAAGTKQVYHGNNCDRSRDADPNDLPTVGILTLRDDGSFDWDDQHTVPRRILLREELRRLVGGSLYPAMRGSPFLAALLIAALLLVGGRCLRRS